MKEARIEISTCCNFKCQVCPHCTKDFEREQKVMDNQLYELILDKIHKANYNIVTLSGFGEAFTDKNVLEKTYMAKKKGMIVNLLTNGSLLNELKIRIMKQIGIDNLRVSLFSNNPSTYSKIHGTDEKYCEIVKNNILFAKEIGLNVTITYNEVDLNKEETYDFIEYWKDKVNLLECWKPHNWGSWGIFRDYRGLMLNTCGRPFANVLQIQVDGTVNMCCFDYNGKLYIGDLKYQEVEDIFTGKEIEKIREAHNLGKFTLEMPCFRCDQRLAEKSSVVIYNSKYDVEERVKMLSTTHRRIDEA